MFAEFALPTDKKFVYVVNALATALRRFISLFVCNGYGVCPAITSAYKMNCLAPAMFRTF